MSRSFWLGLWIFFTLATIVLFVMAGVSSDDIPDQPQKPADYHTNPTSPEAIAYDEARDEYDAADKVMLGFVFGGSFSLMIWIFLSLGLLLTSGGRRTSSMD